MPELDKTTVDAIANLARPITVLTAVEGGTPFAVVPDGYKLLDLTNYVYNDKNATPRRTVGMARAHDADSFVEYVTLFRDAESRIFADDQGGKFLGVLDYHESRGGTPRWGQHRVEFQLRKSREWLLWTKSNGAKMDQLTFGQFIEDNAPDIVSPDSATMLEVARDLTATSGMDFASQQAVANGSVIFKFSEQVKGTFGKDKTEVPQAFEIGIPVYFGGERSAVTARLRYRVNGGKLTFWYDLLRADVIEGQGFQSIATSIEERLAVTLINGTPA